MQSNYVVGNVISINGLKINVLMNEQSNLESFHRDGKIYDGISVGSYIGIIRGSNKIVCRVDREFLEDKQKEPTIREFSRDRFERIIEVSLLGNIYKNEFEFGIKRFPMIFNEAVLLTQEEIGNILQKDVSNSEHKLPIGKSVNNDVLVELSWDKLFNTHIGIFGNTGSGKSNTLAKIYTELFYKELTTINKEFGGKSKFIVLDFNGEYIKQGILSENKKSLNLSTRTNQGDKIKLRTKFFWDIETLSILYSATEKTQQPFLNNAVKHYIDKDSCDITPEKIIEGLGSAFYNIFSQNNNKEMLNLLHKILDIINFDASKKYYNNGRKLDISWLNSSWHSKQNTYYVNNIYFNNCDKESIHEKRKDFNDSLKSAEIYSEINNLSASQKLKIVTISYLIYSLAYGKVNFEFVSPLISRIESRSESIEKTIEITDETVEKGYLTVINLKKCNSEAKKMIPLLIAKQLYEEHKVKNDKFEIKTTIHLIIDEAHNILSTQSAREAEGWKDYRLETFEEIIKEGRKFGFYLTLASQRPSDISPTIMSQLHNYFIHRLVNEQDLRMIENTVSSLDEASRKQIPSLAPGQCIITGTSYSMPLLIKVEKLGNDISPTSESANLVKLWTGKG
ncbi:ATP-binding protein [Staphylococcus pseudintermedius]|uniref:ATP-binding protein n=1 Tax=Staphylococcus pseudintermedius TaxID=283734 RepID=UPI0019D8A3B9|nr:DUF87 domain-containing protein [Staphylococcus pseudintermedius]EGQ3228777.1 DUF87 domain-containing protein [Staphylococcus pseudintermedius]EGQ3875752.1 DUF87 domain-containing protein [Staphylococcus pseudintermedius]EGQ4281143.1 DUF87 domain-containing protein [Staphylococcus pseudintermedius]EHS7218868.1 DUF87 domain-containing protein [Staphylococcus pseudintermedius]EIE3745995.1 DUF87 domain-containing protein [Staphylococcus pseudintermedius]